MKTLFSKRLVLLSSLVVGLVGCGGDDNGGNSGSTKEITVQNMDVASMVGLNSGSAVRSMSAYSNERDGCYSSNMIALDDTENIYNLMDTSEICLVGGIPVNDGIVVTITGTHNVNGEVANGFGFYYIDLNNTMHKLYSSEGDYYKSGVFFGGQSTNKDFFIVKIPGAGEDQTQSHQMFRVDGDTFNSELIDFNLGDSVITFVPDAYNVQPNYNDAIRDLVVLRYGDHSGWVDPADSTLTTRVINLNTLKKYDLPSGEYLDGISGFVFPIGDSYLYLTDATSSNSAISRVVDINTESVVLEYDDSLSSSDYPNYTLAQSISTGKEYYGKVPTIVTVGTTFENGPIECVISQFDTTSGLPLEKFRVSPLNTTCLYDVKVTDNYIVGIYPFDEDIAVVDKFTGLQTIKANPYYNENDPISSGQMWSRAKESYSQDFLIGSNNWTDGDVIKTELAPEYNEVLIYDASELTPLETTE